jgi:hypothetical protein
MSVSKLMQTLEASRHALYQLIQNRPKAITECLLIPSQLASMSEIELQASITLCKGVISCVYCLANKSLDFRLTITRFLCR